MGGKFMKMTIKEGAKEEIVRGRLIGFIDDDECKAIINSEDAPRKIFSSESAAPHDYYGKTTGSRLVFVIYELDDGKNLNRKVFISPVIKSMSYVKGDPKYDCGKKSLFLETNGNDGDE